MGYIRLGRRNPWASVSGLWDRSSRTWLLQIRECEPLPELCLRLPSPGHCWRSQWHAAHQNREHAPHLDDLQWWDLQPQGGIRRLLLWCFQKADFFCQIISIFCFLFSWVKSTILTIRPSVMVRAWFICTIRVVSSSWLKSKSLC